MSVQMNIQNYINLVHVNNTMVKELDEFTDEDIFSDDILIRDFKKASKTPLDEVDLGGESF